MAKFEKRPAGAAKDMETPEGHRVEEAGPTTVQDVHDLFDEAVKAMRLLPHLTGAARSRAERALGEAREAYGLHHAEPDYSDPNWGAS